MLLFDPDAAAAYERLQRPGDARLLDALNDALDALEADPGGQALPGPVVRWWPVGHPSARQGR